MVIVVEITPPTAPARLSAKGNIEESRRGGEFWLRSVTPRSHPPASPTKHVIAVWQCGVAAAVR